MSDLIKRIGIEELYAWKLSMMMKLKKLNEIDEDITKSMDVIDGYVPYHINWRLDNCEKNAEEKYVDRLIWRYLKRFYELSKFMLCTEYKKVSDDIEAFKAPVFTPDVALAWVDSLKEKIRDNINNMIKNVYDNLISSTYYTGSGYSSRQEKKRNNSGIDNHFIITTHDNSRISSWSERVTITDDLEKVCYILDGRKPPEVSVMDLARRDKVDEISCDYFRLKFCKNGNTHYYLSEETIKRLNVMGSKRNQIGEDVWIKIVNKKQ